MASLIVTYHSYMRTNSYWRNGCIVEDGKQSAIVVADYDENRIKIKIAGQSKKPFLLKIIREDFERIRQKYSGLKVRKMIPIDKQEKHFISYEDLKACYEANVKRHFHPESGQHIDVEALYEHIDGGIEQKDRIAEQIKYIRELIEAGKLSRALKKVSELSLVDETKNEVLNYISQLKGVDQDRRLGLATDKDIAIVTNRIRNSFIELLGEIEEDPWLHLE